MSRSGSIFLVGPMGAGKTTVGRHLAKALQREFCDSDREIEQRCGVDIPTIFEKEGEAGFRRREAKVIDELTRRPGIVLATGGGAVLGAENRAHLAARGVVVYLHCTVDDQLARTARGTNRPLLQTADPRARLEALIAERDPLYRAIADLVIDTGRGNTRQIARRIARTLDLPAKQAEHHPPPTRTDTHDA